MNISPLSETKRRPKSSTRRESKIGMNTIDNAPSTRRSKSRDRTDPQSGRKPTSGKVKKRSSKVPVPASHPGDETGQLANMLDQMASKNPVRRGVRSVASMPTQSRPRRRSRDDASRTSRRRLKKDDLAGSNHSSERRPPRRSSSCDENLLEAADRSPVKRRATTKQAYLSEHGDNAGRLGNMLEAMDGKQPKKRSGGRSVASMPVPRTRERSREDLNRSRRPARRTPNGDEQPSRRPPMRSRSSDTQQLASMTRHRSSADRSRKGRSTSPSQTRRGEGSDSGEEGGSRPASRSSRPGSRASRPGSRASRSGSRDRSREPLRRHHSMTPGAKTKPPKKEPERGGGLGRTQSMGMIRETRKSKAESLSNLLQDYNEEDLPSTSYFASSHVLLNRERMKRGRKPLKRNRAMDEIAREHAQSMAENAGESTLKTTYIGNVMRGESIRQIHKSTMEKKDSKERANILNPYFQEFGIGTSKGDDGLLYMCQLFSESLELSMTVAE